MSARVAKCTYLFHSSHPVGIAIGHPHYVMRKLRVLYFTMYVKKRPHLVFIIFTKILIVRFSSYSHTRFLLIKIKCFKFYIVCKAVHIASHCTILQWVDCMSGGVQQQWCQSCGGGNQDGKWIFLNMLSVYMVIIYLFIFLRLPFWISFQCS